MIEIIAHYLAPIMFLTLVAALLLGFPVAFTLAAVGLMFFVIAVELAPYSSDISLSWPLLGALPERIFETMANEILLAVPFFTFMGLVLQRSGMAEDLLETVGQLFGTARGGIAYAVIAVGALLAATTGIVAASVISMGLISLPIMLRYGYDPRIATGVIAASGTLAQIIPPSIVLIVLADQLGQPVGDMYAGALIPGLCLALSYAGFIFVMSVLRPAATPGLPDEAIRFREASGARGLWQFMVMVLVCGWGGRQLQHSFGVFTGADHIIMVIVTAVCIACVAAVLDFGARRYGPWLAFAALAAAVAAHVVWLGQHTATVDILIWILLIAAAYASAAQLLLRVFGVTLISTIARRVTFVMVPPLLLVFLVLGTIFMGIATPTEGGAMGALGSLVLAAIKRWTDRDPGRFNAKVLWEATEQTAKLSAFVMFILLGARVFSLTFYGVNGHIWVEELLTNIPGGIIGFLILVNLIVFVLAFFLDFFELAFVVIPLLIPAAETLGVDLVWFGIMLSVNIQTSFLSPPFGFALFFLRSVAPNAVYTDPVTGKTMPRISTGQIYWGVVPFLALQMMMVVLVVIFPEMVTHYNNDAVLIDDATVNEQLKNLVLPEF